MSKTVKVGDIVRLRSGGPDMTVVAVGSFGHPLGLQCAWFDLSGTYAVADFPLAAVEKSRESAARAVANADLAGQKACSRNPWEASTSLPGG